MRNVYEPPRPMAARFKQHQSKEVFDESIAPYQQAPKESGYDHKLTYNPEPTPRNKRKRKRDITWYNPPFDSNVKTNLGRKFLHIVDKCFQKSHPFYKIFNRHNLKLSYSCMPNMKSVVSSHTKTRSLKCKCINAAT